MATVRIWLDRIIFVSICAIIFVLPLSKSAFEIFFIIALVCRVLKQDFRPIITGVNLAVLFFVFANLLSILHSASAALSLKGFFFKLMEGVILFFLVSESVNSKNRLNIVLLSIFSSVIIVGSDGVFQFITGWDFIRHYDLYANQMRATFSNPNGMAGWLIAIIPLILSLVIKNRSSKPERFIRLALWGIISLMTLCLVLTYSRGAWIGAALSLIFLAIFKKSGLLISIIFAIIAFPFIAPPVLKERILDLLRFKVPYSVKELLASIVLFTEPVRNGLWREAALIIKDFPLFGCGINTYSIVAPHYKIAETGGGYPHNCYLHMAAETGLVGLFSFLLMMLLLFVKPLLNLKKMEDEFCKNVLLGLLAGLFGFLVHSFFDVNFYALQLANLMWFIMGLIIAVQKIDVKEKIA